MSDLQIASGPDEQWQWPGHGGPVEVRLYRTAAAAAARDALLVFFHPGGFVVEDSSAGDHCLRVLADACEINIIAPCYALAPEHPFPAAVEDAHSVLAQAHEHRALLGWKGKQLFVGGVEAGGNLAAVSAMMCRDRQGPSLAGQILVMPMLDAGLHCSSMRSASDQPATRDVVNALEKSYRSYLPHPSDRLHPYASPLQSSRLSQLAPALIFYTQGDPLEDEAQAYACKLASAGNQVELVALPPADVADEEQRCAITADDPCVTAMKQFLSLHR